MKINEIINESEMDLKAQKPKKITIIQAFGSDEINILNKAGIYLLEKPSHWEDLESSEGYVKYNPITKTSLTKVEKIFAKNGFKLAVLKAKDVYGTDPSGPLSSYKNKPTEQCYIIEMSNGKRYLCDRTGANSYTRMWALIK